MARLLSLRCENCNATLPAPRGDVVECDHCHHKHKVDQPAPPRPVVEVREVHVHHPREPRPSGARLGLLVPFVLVPLAVAGYWLFIKGRVGGVGSGGSAGGGFGEHLVWESNGGPPLPVTVGGREAFLGRVRASHAGDQLSIVLVDPTEVKFLWRSEPLGSYSDAYQAAWFAASGDRAVYSDAKGTIHIVDLATGKEQKTLAVTDKVTALCPLDANQVVAGVADGRDQLIDVVAGTLSDAPKGKSCASRRRGGDPRREATRGLPKVEGFKAETMHLDDGVAVAGGTKSPGTALPQAVAFDASTWKVLWNQPVAQVDRAQVRELHETYDGLAAGRYVVLYGVGQDGWRVAAFDARSGSRLWDTLLRPIFAVDSIDEIVVMKERVLVTRTSSLDVLDAKTGKLVGTVGTETYD